MWLFGAVRDVARDAIAWTTGPIRRYLHSARPLVSSDTLISRQFKSALKGDESVRGAEGVRVISYNVLGPVHGISSKHGYSPLSERDWNVRFARISAELIHYDADILCLQEVTSTTFQRDFNPFLSARGYIGFHQRKEPVSRKSIATGLRIALVVDISDDFTVFGAVDDDAILGIATFIRASRFSVVDHESMIIPDLLEDEELVGVDLPERYRADLASKPDTVAITLLRSKPSSSDDETEGKLVAVANVHLYWNPNQADVKAFQAYLATRALRRFLIRHSLFNPQQQQEDEICTVMCGDFNSLPRLQPEFCPHIPEGSDIPEEHARSGVFEVMTKARLDSSHPEHPSHYLTNQAPDIESLDTQLFLFTPADFAPFTPYQATTKTDSFCGRIDYVFVNKSCKVNMVLELPTTDFESFPPIPNAVWPSDHLAVGAVLTF